METDDFCKILPICNKSLYKQKFKAVFGSLGKNFRRTVTNGVCQRNRDVKHFQHLSAVCPPNGGSVSAVSLFILCRTVALKTNRVVWSAEDTKICSTKHTSWYPGLILVSIIFSVFSVFTWTQKNLDIHIPVHMTKISIQILIAALFCAGACNVHYLQQVNHGNV